MRAGHHDYQAVLTAAERVLEAREAQMLTADEWDELLHAVAACQEPPAAKRIDTFTVADDRALVRSVIPTRGEPYEHTCDYATYKAVAHAVAEATEPFTSDDLRAATKAPWTKIAVAFAFLKERSVVIPSRGRRHIASSTTPFEDAMVEYHALRENPSGA